MVYFLIVNEILNIFFESFSTKLAGISAEAQHLLSQLLEVDPGRRLSATEALRHPWITGEGHAEHHDTHLSDASANHRTTVTGGGARSPTAVMPEGPKKQSSLLGFLFHSHATVAPAPAPVSAPTGSRPGSALAPRPASATVAK